jgi:GntR family transcriptional repressor for pyruvate dehydrogenase complex
VERATAAIIDMIAGSRYWPGDRLPAERQLAEQLSLSRPTLREALGVLSQAGILDQRHGSGTYIVAIAIDEVFAVRLRLEPWAAELAAANRTDEHLQALADLVSELGEEIDDPLAFTAVDRRIHRLIAEAAGNGVLLDHLERLGDLTRLSRAITGPSLDVRRETLDYMREINDAMAASDGRRAAAAMQGHLEGARASAEDTLRTHALESDAADEGEDTGETS